MPDVLSHVVRPVPCLFLCCAVLCSDDPPYAFATSSLRVGQRKSLHDDIMPEVAEELGPGAQCMVAHPLVLIHFQHTHAHAHAHTHTQTRTHTHTHTHRHMHTCVLTLSPSALTQILLCTHLHITIHLYSHAVQRP